MKRKMNGLYKTAFILLLVGAALFIASVITAYVFNETTFSAVFSCSGCALVLLGIIFASLSKPKRKKNRDLSDETEKKI